MVVDDLAAAIAFFVEVGFELNGEVSVDGPAVDRINGLEGVQADVAMLQTPDGRGRLELSKYRSPPYDGEPEQAPPPGEKKKKKKKKKKKVRNVSSTARAAPCRPASAASRRPPARPRAR